MNLKALFRPISMVTPDSKLITEILLYSSGFVGAQQLAKKIVSVQSLADTLMRKTLISHDFGLRSIKAIVTNAEAIKLQAQNIMDSELTDIIDDASLNSVPYEASQIVKDVLAQSQARVNHGTNSSDGFSKEEYMVTAHLSRDQSSKGLDDMDQESCSETLEDLQAQNDGDRRQRRRGELEQ